MPPAITLNALPLRCIDLIPCLLPVPYRSFHQEFSASSPALLPKEVSTSSPALAAGATNPIPASRCRGTGFPLKAKGKGVIIVNYKYNYATNYQI